MENKTKAQDNVKDVKPKTQKASKSYTLTSLANNIVKLSDLGLITEKEVYTLTEIKNNAVEKYMKEQFNI